MSDEVALAGGGVEWPPSPNVPGDFANQFAHDMPRQPVELVARSTCSNWSSDARQATSRGMGAVGKESRRPRKKRRLPKVLKTLGRLRNVVLV